MLSIGWRVKWRIFRRYGVAVARRCGISKGKCCERIIGLVFGELVFSQFLDILGGRGPFVLGGKMKY
jgi:hypothetical protein